MRLLYLVCQINESENVYKEELEFDLETSKSYIILIQQILMKKEDVSSANVAHEQFESCTLRGLRSRWFVLQLKESS